MKRLIFVFLLGWSLVTCAFEVGFYNPEGVDESFKSNIDFAMIEVISEEQVLRAMSQAQEMGLSLTLNLGPAFTRSIKAEDLNNQYINAAGQRVTKLFAPKYHHKIKSFVTNREIKLVLDRLALAMKRFPNVIDTIFLVDEPYLKGISRREIDRVSLFVKDYLSQQGIENIKTGVVFASLTYDSDYAEELDRQAIEYVRKADAKRIEIENLNLFGQIARWIAGKDQWIENFRDNRLITYDQAGNIYKGGGIPKALDVVGFDFYVATLLLDDLYVNALAWMEEHYDVPHCNPFASKQMESVHQHLSFIGSSENVFEGMQSDRKLLDAIFDCRTGTVAEALRANLNNPHVEVIMIGESSSNGFLSFKSDRSPRGAQDWDSVEERVRIEVERHLTRPVVQTIPNLKRVAFFTFGNPTDHSIGQTIRGAREMPTVLELISNH
jgi:hypothetical protein